MNPGDQLFNPATGERLIFIHTTAGTRGEMLEVESIWERPGDPPPEHLHPHQTERFQVLEGRVAARIDGSDRTLQPGETFELAPGMPHTMWNPGPGPARAIWQTQPALGTEAFFAAMWGLAQTGQVNAKGRPPLRLGLRLVAAHQREFRLTRPAWPLQRLAFLLFGITSGVELKGSSAEVRADSCYVGRPE